MCVWVLPARKHLRTLAGTGVLSTAAPSASSVGLCEHMLVTRCKRTLLQKLFGLFDQLGRFLVLFVAALRWRRSCHAHNNLNKLLGTFLCLLCFLLCFLLSLWCLERLWSRLASDDVLPCEASSLLSLLCRLSPIVTCRAMCGWKFDCNLCSTNDQ